MLFFNNFNINIGFNFGMNNWFSPINSCLGGFSGFNMCSLFTNPFSMSAMPMFNFNNIWSSFGNNSIGFNNFNLNNNVLSNNIFSASNFGSFWDNSAMFNSISMNNSSIWSNNTTAVTKPSDTFEKTNNYKAITLDGYNAEKGKKLAQIAWNGRNTKKVWNSKKKIWTDFTGYCCKSVKTALESAGLAPYYDGHAFQMITPLRNNKNFKEIAVSEDNYKNLPAGCILVYGKGVSGYDKDNGHIEVITEDGKGVSDGVTQNIRKPSAIFMPV